VPIAAITALQGLRDKGQLEKGQHVLIIGASGGVGTFAVQIAKTLGAKVTAVCSTRNADMVRSIGADHVIDYTSDDFVEAEERYDLILDAIGNRPLSAYRRVMTPTGRYVAVGGSKKMRSLLSRMAWMALRSRFAKQKMTSMLANQTPDDMKVLTDWLQSGAVIPVIDRTYPLNEAAQALAYQGEGHTRGKIVIEVSSDSDVENP
ncbi:MAG: NAD(P)-dependent alcohol dehydrogenase, partial [Acidimicrobiia bacterium]|nr:NAD(P)-dependent alcohol dehydrogenase [Acidimicrobiia bacterium]